MIGGESLTILEVDKFVVKAEKQAEMMALWQKTIKYLKKQPEKTKAKSTKIYTQLLGGIFGSFVVTFKYDSLADWEKDYASMMKDETFVKVYEASLAMIVPGTYSITILNAVEEESVEVPHDTPMSRIHT